MKAVFAAQICVTSTLACARAASLRAPLTATFAAALALALVAPAPLSAQNLLASDPDGVMLAMQKAGYLVTRETSDDGTPRLDSRVSDSSFRVYFYGCETATDPCTSVQFSAGYDLDAGFDAAKINTWNNENRYARALLDDESDPFLRMDVMMSSDGIGPEAFADTLDIWRILVEDFEDYIDW